MSSLAIVVIVAGLVMFFLLVELAAAVLPLLIIVTVVPPEERESLAALIAAADSSRRLRLWSALRVAVAARRLVRARNTSRDPGGWSDRDQRPPVSDPAGRSPGSPC